MSGRTKKIIKTWEKPQTTPNDKPTDQAYKAARSEIDIQAKQIIQNFEQPSNGTATFTNATNNRTPDPRHGPGAAKKLINNYEKQRSVEPPAPVATKAKPDKKVVTGDKKVVTGDKVVKQSQKKALIVYAHTESTSFNAALRQTTEKVLTELGHQVTVSDLYQMNFNPLTTKADIQGEPADSNHFDYNQECGRAWESGKLAGDIVAEHEKLDLADLVILQFPLQWMGFPAILKGWVDRVFTNKYAYGDGKMYDTARFKGTKALLSFTVADGESCHSPAGVHGDMDVTLWSIQNGVLHFCGFDVLAPQISYSPSLVGQQAREAMLAAWATRLKTIWSEKPLSFLALDCFDPASGFELGDKALQESAKAKVGPTVGQHLGKPLPEGSMTKIPK